MPGSLLLHVGLQLLQNGLAARRILVFLRNKVLDDAKTRAAVLLDYWAIELLLRSIFICASTCIGTTGRR